MNYLPDVTAEYRTTPPLKEVYEGYSWRKFKGTREALLATGLFRPEWFPGEPGMRRHTTKVMHEGRKISISRRSPRLFDGYIGFTAEEQASRAQIEKTKRRLGALHDDLAALPGSADEYRCLLLRAELRLFCEVKSLAEGELRTGGYRYNDEARARIAQCFSSLIQALKRGKIEFDSAKREAVLHEVYAHHGTEAPPDTGFASFLARVSTPGTQLDEGEEPTT